MAFVKSLRLLNLLVITLILCDNVTVGVDFFEVTKEAYEKQQKFLEQWNDLVTRGEITRGLHKTFPIYKFEGETVQKMKVKDIFCMLQNWLHLHTDSTHRFVEMNIGGKSYRFRIHLNLFGKSHIVIKNEEGQSPTKYETIFEQFDKFKGNIKEIAEAMLKSSNEPMNAQTKWSVGDEETREVMREMMVITQVAEAARPTEQSYNALLRIMDTVTEEATWKEEVNKLKPKTGRIPGSDKTVRKILQQITKGEFSSFRKAFHDLFPISITTQKGRESLFEIGNQFDAVSSSDSDTDSEEHQDKPPKRKRVDSEVDSEVKPPQKRLDSKAVAVSDGDKSNLQDKIKEELEKTSCKKRRKRDGSCTVKRLKVVDDSLRWEGESLYFQTVDEDGRKITHEVEVDLKKTATPEFTKERLSNLKESGLLKGTDTTGKALGVYGAAVGILASIQYFSQGESGRALFSLSQATHAIGGLTGLNNVLEQAVRKTVTYTAEQIGLEKTLEKMSELGAKALGESTSKVLSRFIGDLPFVGLAFDAYFIVEDIKDLTDENSSTPAFLKITHLILDVETTILTLVETALPPLAEVLEPFIIASTIVRISIDNFYLDIQDELAKVKGKGFGEQVGAFTKGFLEGYADFFTLGLVQQIKGLKRQQEYNRQQLTNLSNPASYFNVTFQGLDGNGEPVGTVDFTAGILSQFGGFLTVKLNKNGTFTVELPEVPTESGIPTRVVRTFSFGHPVNDVVLGVGEVASPRYIRKEAKLWLFIPVEQFDIIDGFDTHQSSQYGVYTGNSHDNNFYAVQGGKERKKRSPLYKKLRHRRTTRTEQDCVSSSEIKVHLNSYHYDLYGRGGNDRFFLGPQTSRVAGGDDNDLYFIYANGRAIIDNFAHDQEMDTLFLNVSHERIRCARDEWDLLVSYCQDTSHVIKIKNWFSHGKEQFYRHIYLATQDGVVIGVPKSEVNNAQYQISCSAVSVDKSSSTSAETLTLTGSLSQVKQATGSNYSDVITGNEKPNILSGGLGDDEITGANGSDIYLVNRGGGRDTINNYATDKQVDTIIFGVPFAEILVEKSRQTDLVMHALTGDRSTTQVTLQSWFTGSDWKHAVFVSSDYITFEVKEDSNGIPRKHPHSIDFSEFQHGARLNLRNSNAKHQSIYIEEQLAEKVKVIMDSPYNDTLIGNALGNFLTCSGGIDFLQGNEGKDTYVIKERCSGVIIENIDSKGDFDMMLLNCSSQNIRLILFSSHLILRCNLNNGYFEVHLNNWFQSPEQRHLIVKTSDKIAALLPETTAEHNLNQGRLFPYQIEADEDCDGELCVINLNVPPYSKCERFVAKTDLCSYSIIGNELNNYIDPGPGNPFGSQNLTGNNGTDTYVMGHRYGTFNTIDNFAEDKELDHLKLDVIFHDIEVSRDVSDATLTSRSRNDSIRVTVVNYYTGVTYQHLLVHSIDGVLFKLSDEFPYIKVIIVDFSTSMFSQVLSAHVNTTFSTARVLLGSKFAENHIEGGKHTTKIIGGQKNDTIIGGPGGEDLIGLDGHDTIYGGPGNDALYGGDGDDFLDGGLDDDVFYGGMGADTIIGGPGSNTVVFSGHSLTGVNINLQIGLGWDADAEGDSFEMINNILSSEYDDFLIGNDDNNVIRAYGGEDFIFPAGGDDLLQGGRGSDIYQLDNAFGHKVINNFATDEELDLIVLNQTSLHGICYYFYGEDLQLTVGFDNSTEAVSRDFLGQNFLMITLPFWLRNSTYQHIAFSFSDGYLTPEDFDESYRQLEPMINLVRSGQLLYSTIVSATSIRLIFNVSSWNDVNDSHETVSLQYVHFEYNSTTYYPLNLPPPESVTVNNLAAGSTHSFTLILSSCELNVAISPLLYGTIPPNQPTGLIADPLLDGFVIHWNPPTSLTDPSVQDYEYNVRIWSVEQAGDNFEQTTNSSNISVFSLIPETEYHISVSSLVYNTTNTPAQITIRTGKNTCTNLVNLPSHLRIEDSTRNEQGYIVAIVSCETGYELEGSSNIICNDVTSIIPRCSITECTLPVVTNAELVVGSDNPVYEDTFSWRCVHGYEISRDGTNTFSSVCGHQSQWTPEIPTCYEKSKCTGLKAPQFGSVNATAIYVEENVTYSCSSGYNLQGPAHKQCTRVAGIEAFLSPSDVTQCVPRVCPALLPQTHGFYNNIRSQYVTGDMVELVCNGGYYARDDRDYPEPMMFICNGYDWNPPQRHCQSIIEVFDARHYISHVDVSVQYTISSRQGTIVPTSLYPRACRQILPHFTKWVLNPETLLSIHPRLDCHRAIYFANGPTRYEGILKISSENDFAYVCVMSNHLHTATEVCRQLGYEQYTSSIYHSASAIQTTYISQTSSPTKISQHEQLCNHRISCRRTCDQLFLPHGNWQFGCPQTLEGQTCDFSCDAGYGMIGSSSRTCTSNGWTGNHPFCDGELWKTDIERESREKSDLTHHGLSIYLKNYLCVNYPGVYWMVAVYDPISGSDKHTVSGYGYYHLFRHYGHNIVVGHSLPNIGSSHNDLSVLFWRAYSRQYDKKGWGGSVLNAQRTVSATWDKLVNLGVRPDMLLIYRSTYSGAWASCYDENRVYTTDGVVLLI
ncbi:uncharacterized protein LOC117307061 [Asterias rubens]|uniref:uncharacterized protein LOC117307061 n=1 Tax=Asterias rubens TaxID=7604 RepID=UPI0014559FE4|nr:uncharacterized protein LOC117307061 [Asterias rubens]XP_033647600.1 uncharacterized protein LOC117307061 [Asterias rubens]XP_033647601.1 uncharacterized protein LOC117307061 [Asterias rubens]